MTPPRGAFTDEDGVIVLGDISDDPANVIEEMQPLADYLAANLGDYGIMQGDIVVVGSTEEMAEKLASGEIDLYFDSVYPATVVSDASGAQPFLRRWRDGVEEYHTVIFTTSDSGVESIQGLQGQMIAFDEPTSTSGFVLPYVYLLEQGLTLVEKQSPEDEVAPDEVGYVFSEDDDNSLDWVNTGRVAAAATDNISYEEDIPEDIRANLVVLGETEALPRQVAVVRPDMNPELQAAIVDVLVHMHESEAGQAALEEFDDTARFDEFPEGLDTAVARMHELLEIVEASTTP
jgi:phosphonate transport system substrate-binding protein